MALDISKAADFFKFSEKEKKIIKIVFFFSFAACIIAVGATWGVMKLRLHQTINITTLNETPTDMMGIFEKKRDLISIDIDAHRFAARHFTRTNQPQKAIPHLLRLLSVIKYDRIERFELAKAYLDATQYDKALSLLTELNEEKNRDSLSESIAAVYGLALFHNNQIEHSIQTLDNVLRQYPQSAEAYCYRGQVEAAVNSSSPSAIEYFKKSLELKPDYTEAMYQWARFLMNKPAHANQDLDTARLQLSRILEVEPLNPKVHARLGMVYYYFGQWPLAEKAYRTALALNPGDFNTRYNLGELYYTMYWNSVDITEDQRKALRKKAAAEFDTTLKINTTHADACFKLGLISLEANMVNGAVEYLNKAHALEPKNIRFLLQLAVAYEKQDNKNEAVRVYNSILDIDPINEIAKQKLKLLTRYFE